MAEEPVGYFSTPYSEQEVLRLAKSSDPLERWEAANLLSELGETDGAPIFELLKGDPDSLVQKALVNQRNRFGANFLTATAPKLSGNRGAFREAWAQSLGPYKVERLSNTAKAAAEAAIEARSNSRGDISFPQANSVEILIEMLDQVIDTDCIHGAKLGLVDRQVLYYRDALRYINLIELTPTRKIVANPKLLELSSPYQRLNFVICALLQSPSTSVAYVGLIGEDAVDDFPIPTNVREYLEYFASSPEARGLSGSTLTRRAQTGLAWATQILNLLKIHVRDPAAWKAGVPKFMSLNPASGADKGR